MVTCGWKAKLQRKSYLCLKKKERKKTPHTYGQGLNASLKTQRSSRLWGAVCGAERYSSCVLQRKNVRGRVSSCLGVWSYPRSWNSPQTQWASLEEETGEWRQRGLRGGTVQGNESPARISFQHCLPSHSWSKPLPDCLLISLIPCNWASLLPWIRLTEFLCLQTGPPSRN